MKNSRITLTDIKNANLKHNNKNMKELELLDKIELNDEVLNLIIRRYTRLQNRNRERPATNTYSKYKTNILKSFKNKYDNDEEFNKKIKTTALNHYYKDIEKEREKRRAYYHKNREKLNNKNKERNKKNRNLKKDDKNNNIYMDIIEV